MSSKLISMPLVLRTWPKSSIYLHHSRGLVSEVHQACLDVLIQCSEDTGDFFSSDGSCVGVEERVNSETRLLRSGYQAAIYSCSLAILQTVFFDNFLSPPDLILISTVPSLFFHWPFLSYIDN